MAVERKEAANNNGYPTTVYGTTSVNDLRFKGADVSDSGSGQEYIAEYVFDVTELPSQSETDPSVYTFDSDSVPTRVDLSVVETLSGGTSVDVGLAEPDGTAIDADGLVAAFAGTAAGTYAKGAGALIDTVIGADGQLDVTTDHTAGKLLVRVYYTQTQQ
jgi:hypothetical protein